MRRWAFIAMIVGSIVGCASTTVRKNPGNLDNGIRFYRPKPYLKIAPADAAPQEYVTVALEYLPDFGEEYSIHVRAGLGINKTKVTLDKGWNLTQVDNDIDQKFADNLKAATEFITKVAPLVKVRDVDSGKPTPEAPQVMVIRANNVPFGYYESVIAEGPDSKKRLYGWRYVGFAPYLQCPQEPTGAECVGCNLNGLYGLMMREGVMTFVALDDGVNLTRAYANSVATPKTAKAEAPQKFDVNLNVTNSASTPDSSKVK